MAGATKAAELTPRGREMQGLIGEWERSGQPMAEFAVQHGTTASTLGWWRSEIKRRKRRASNGATGAAPMRLVEIERPSAAAKSFEVRLANGVTVGVPAGFDRRALAELLAVLRAC